MDEMLVCEACGKSYKVENVQVINVRFKRDGKVEKVHQVKFGDRVYHLCPSCFPVLFRWFLKENGIYNIEIVDDEEEQ